LVKFIVALFIALGAATMLAQAPVVSQQPSSPPTELPPAPHAELQPPTDPATRPSFAEWLEAVRAEALARGVRQEVVAEALADIEEPLPVVLERDRTQAETILSIEAYLRRQITAQRVRTGREKAAQHTRALERVAKTYGVPVRIIVGIWGMESNFGRFSGVRPTVSALATLAWDPRRAAYFRGELFSALEILNRGDIELTSLKGSWAGAMGQPQFMPSSYLQYAQDFDGDGRRDIWNTPSDVFASIANYLKGHGWTEGQRWGREVSIPKAVASRLAGTIERRAGTCRATRDMSVALPLAEWRRLGVRTLSGAALPQADTRAALVSGTTRHFLVYSNYDALLQYNCAHAYALSVALLGDRLAAAPRAAKAASARPRGSNKTRRPAPATKARPRPGAAR